MNEHETLEAIWGCRLLDEGFLGIPNIIVRNYRKLGIEHGEFGLICTILTYKHDTRDPYPSHERLAEHMGCSTRQVRKWVDNLESKGLLLIGRRQNSKNKQFGSMVYNFRPLIEETLKLVGEKPIFDENDVWDIVYQKPAELKFPLESEIPQEPQVPVEPKVPEDVEPEVQNSEPEVPLNISSNRSFEYNLSSNTISPTRKIDEMLHERLKNTFSRATYESWFADTHIYDMDSNNTYIASPVEFILRFLEERHKDTLQEILKDIMGNPGEIKFILLK